MIRKPLRFTNLSANDSISLSDLIDEDCFLWIQDSQIHLKVSNDNNSNSIKNLSVFNLVDTNDDESNIPIWEKLKFYSASLDITINKSTIIGETNYQFNIETKSNNLSADKPLHFDEIKDFTSYKNYIVDLSDSNTEYYILVDSALDFEPIIHIDIIKNSLNREKHNLLLRNDSNEEIKFLIKSEFIKNSIINIDGYDGNGIIITLNPKQICKVGISEFGFKENNGSYTDYLSMINDSNISFINNNTLGKRNVIVKLFEFYSGDTVRILDSTETLIAPELTDTNTSFGISEDSATPSNIKFIDIRTEDDLEIFRINGVDMTIPAKGENNTYRFDVSTTLALPSDAIFEISLDKEILYPPREPKESDYCIFVEASLMSNFPN